VSLWHSSRRKLVIITIITYIAVGVMLIGSVNRVTPRSELIIHAWYTWLLINATTFTVYDLSVLQWHYECYCGDSYDRLGLADNCNTPCGGNRDQICGGDHALSVYSGSLSCFLFFIIGSKSLYCKKAVNTLRGKNGLHAFGNNSAESEPIWMSSGTVWAKCGGWLWQILGAIRAVVTVWEESLFQKHAMS